MRQLVKFMLLVLILQWYSPLQIITDIRRVQEEFWWTINQSILYYDQGATKSHARNKNWNKKMKWLIKITNCKYARFPKILKLFSTYFCPTRPLILILKQSLNACILNLRYTWCNTIVVTFRNPTSKCNWGKLSHTTLQPTLPVPLLHDPILPDILRMAAKEMIFSLSSEGASGSLGAFSGSGSLSPWQLSVTSEETSCWVSLKTSSSIVSTWLLFEAEMRGDIELLIEIKVLKELFVRLAFKTFKTSKTEECRIFVRTGSVKKSWICNNK